MSTSGVNEVKSWCPNCEDRDPQCMACAGHGYERAQRGKDRCACGNQLLHGASICVDCLPIDRSEKLKATAMAALRQMAAGGYSDPENLTSEECQAVLDEIDRLTQRIKDLGRALMEAKR